MKLTLSTGFLLPVVPRLLDRRTLSYDILPLRAKCYTKLRGSAVGYRKTTQMPLAEGLGRALSSCWQKKTGTGSPLGMNAVDLDHQARPEFSASPDLMHHARFFSRLGCGRGPSIRSAGSV